MEEFDLTIIGGGVGGLVAASGASQFGAKVALVEKENLGGDCLHYGCVPTKTLVHSARLISLMRRATEFGLNPVTVDFEFKKIMEHMREVQKKVGEHDDPKRFEKMGIKLFFGKGGFKDTRTFEVNGTNIKSRKFLIATGSRPVKLPIPGLDKVDSLDNIKILAINHLPESILIMGAGPIGMEFAQVFSRFGSKVTVIEKAGQILPREEKELSDRLEGILKREGMEIITCVETKRVEQSGNKRIVVAECSGKEKRFEADELLVAIGRAPNIEGMNLEKIGVKTTSKGIVVNDTMKTTVSNIWACGDVTGMFPFTHMAEYEAGIVIGNALFPFVNRKMDKTVVPWTTFTDPELARVGLTEDEARKEYGDIRVYRYPFSEHDRAIIDGETEGMIKLICDKKGKILGAHILGKGAGDLLNEYTFAMKNGLPVQKISQTVHVYPTMGQVVKRGADQYYKERLFSGWFPKVARFLMKFK
ncbi:MAG: dihydrolipoyl dehydrogenase [Deltaproteobacteria bacterium]|nr:dihydrolipoyl dehydrogenase [Deltaproteobacteria bacterium]